MKEINSVEQLESFLAGQEQFGSFAFSEFEWPEESTDYIFKQCTFHQMIFRGTEWQSCEFTDCEFEQCTFDSSKLTDCLFQKCKFYNPELEAACSFKFASFPGTTFRQSDLSLCNFSRSNLYRIVIDQCQATGMDCSYATVSQSIGGSLSLNRARLFDCNFSYADFTGTWLCEAELQENRFSHALFNRANLEGAVLNDCDFHGIEAKGLTIAGADLRGAQISGLDIREIDMTGVRINDYQQRFLLEAIGIEVD